MSLRDKRPGSIPHFETPPFILRVQQGETLLPIEQRHQFLPMWPGQPDLYDHPHFGGMLHRRLPRQRRGIVVCVCGMEFALRSSQTDASNSATMVR